MPIPCITPLLLLRLTLLRHSCRPQYRPYRRGLPLSTGYGLPQVAAPLGYLRVELELRLREPLHLLLLRNPALYSEPPYVVPDVSPHLRYLSVYQGCLSRSLLPVYLLHQSSQDFCTPCSSHHPH